MNLDNFTEKLTIISQWNAGGELFRLVNLGAGPDQLQIKVNGEWKEESNQFKWGSSTNRIKSLEKNANTKDILLNQLRHYLHNIKFIKDREKWDNKAIELINEYFGNNGKYIETDFFEIKS